MSIGRAVGLARAEAQEIVDDTVDDYLPLAGGTISGPVRLQTTLGNPLALYVEGPAGGTPTIPFYLGGIKTATIYTRSDGFTLTHQGAEYTSLKMADSRISANKPISASAPVNSSDLTTKSYVDAADTALRDLITAIQNLLDVDDEALDTLQEIVDRIRAVDPDLDGLQVADVSGLVPALAAKASIVYIDDQIANNPGPQGDEGAQGLKGDTGDEGPQGLKGDTGDEGPQGLKGDTGDTGPQGLAGADGEDYDPSALDAKYDKSGGTIDGNVTTKGHVLVDGESGIASLYLDGGPTSPSHLWFRQDGANVGILYYDGNNMRLRNYADDHSTVANEMVLSDGITSFSKPVRVNADPSNGDDLTRKSWVDGQLSGKANSTHNHSAANITSGTLPNARVSQGNVTQHQAALAISESQISDFDDYLPLSGGTLSGPLNVDNDLKVGPDQFEVYRDNNKIVETSQFQDTFKLIFFAPNVAAGVGNAEFELRNSRNEAFRFGSHKDMTESHTILMPKTKPTAVGQKLEVESISGQVITMKWA